MAIELGKGAQCFRVLFIITNIIFLVFGLVLLGIGIWLVVVADDQEEAETITGDSYRAGGALLIVAAIVTLLVCAVGILGAIILSRIVLIIYVCVVLVLVILEVAAAGIGFAYREEIRDEFEERFIEAIDDYREPDGSGYQEDVNDAIEYIQEEFECCGATNWTDWERNDLFCSNGGPPGDCDCMPGDDDDCITVTGYVSDTCGPSPLEFSVWDQGCVDDVEDTLEEYALVLGALAIVIAIIEALGIVVAIGLCLCVHASVKQTVV